MRLGRLQLALLLIVDQATRVPEGCDEPVGRAFVWEESIRYVDLSGEHASFFMMRRDLKSLERLCDLGLVTRRVSGYTTLYAVTDSGRAHVARLRATHKLKEI